MTIVSTKQKPILSIALPAYNEEKHLAEALDSIMYQLSDVQFDYEVLILDNASTDQTKNIGEKYASKYPKIRYIRNESNVGAIENSNKAVKLSNGEFFMWVGAHDILSDNYIQNCLQIMQSDSSAVVAYPRTIWIDENGNELNIKSGFIDTRGDWVISRFNLTLWTNQHAMYGLIRSDALKKTRLMKQMIASDAILLLELSLLGSFAHVPEAIWYRRKNRDDEDSYQQIARYRRMLFSSDRYAKSKFPHWKFPYECLAVIWNGPISFKRKVALAVSALPSIFVRNGPAMLADIYYLFHRYFLINKRTKL